MVAYLTNFSDLDKKSAACNRNSAYFEVEYYSELLSNTNLLSPEAQSTHILSLCVVIDLIAFLAANIDVFSFSG